MTGYLKIKKRLKAYVRNVDRLKDWVEYIVITVVIAKLFYDSLYAAIPFLAGIYFYVRYKEEGRCMQQQSLVREEFICALDGMCSALSAGYSLLNSFPEAARQVKKVYGEKSVTYTDFMIIIRQISLNTNLDEILTKYSRRSLIDEIRYFCGIIPVTVKEGADIVGVIKEIRAMALERIELERQIKVVSASKKSEAVIMSLMPIGIMCYLRISSPEFFDEMYGNFRGVVIMTIILAAYIMLVIITDRISRIKGG